ncbi:MAG: plasmid replication initiator RepA, partial [Pseudomonadota bacterium]
AVRRMMQDGLLPDYTLTEALGDLVVVTRDAHVLAVGEAPVLGPDVLEAARALAPGADVYALEATWQRFWADSGRPRLGDPGRAFLGWVKTQRGQLD